MSLIDSQLQNDLPLRDKLNLETALAPWHELQRFFAAGQTIQVHAGVNLIEVASVISEDNASLLKIWMDNGQVEPVTDEQAKQWYEQAADVWTVVVKPWVLVQGMDDRSK